MRLTTSHTNAPVATSRGATAGASRRASERRLSVLRRQLLVGAGVGAAVAFPLGGQPLQALAAVSEIRPKGAAVVEGQTILLPAGGVGFESTSVKAGDVSVPVAVWYPSDAQGSPQPQAVATKYPQRTSFGKIINTFLGLSLPVALLRTDNELEASPCVAQGAQKSLGQGQRAVVLAHGYLGSRFDLIHIAERLAALGFVVMAPEFGDSRSGEVPAPPRRSQPEGVPAPTASREEILMATLQTLKTDFGIREDHIGLVGHSAGSGTISKAQGPYPRVSLAGFVPSADSRPAGPYLVVTSSGDSLISFQGGMPAIRAKLPGDFDILDPSQGIAADSAPRAAALLLSVPNHISFLSERSNEAMLRTLGPLLPVARLLNLRLLDFDKYAESRDSRATAAVVLPVIEKFICYHLGHTPPAN